MDILYLIVPNRGIWFGWNGSQPLVQSELSNLQENSWLGWTLWADATVIVVSISLKGPFQVKEKCQVIICMHVLSNLVNVRGIKCTCKRGNLSNFYV